MNEYGSLTNYPIKDWKMALYKPFQMVQLRLWYLGEPASGQSSVTETFAFTLPQAEQLLSDLQKLVAELKKGQESESHQ